MEPDQIVPEMPKSEDAQPQVSSPSRRSFLGKAGGLGAAAIAASMVPLEPLLGGKESQADASVINYNGSSRAAACHSYRIAMANNNHLNIAPPPDNGDAARFSDHSGSWSKCLLHDSLGIVNQASWASFINALTSGNYSDFDNIIVGNPGGTNFTATLNGPMGAYAFDLEGIDSHCALIPPSPSTSSAQTAAEEVEHYWGALLRDVPFGQYETSSLAAAAAADLNNMSFLQSSANNYFPYPVTPQNLFRGRPAKNSPAEKGPYVSQFMLQPTFLGAQPLNQMLENFLPGVDFLTDPVEFLRVQNGQKPAFPLKTDPVFRLIRNGRALATYTHVDALHQAYLVAALVLLGIGAPLNPGIPYTRSKTQHGFGTLGGPDVLATIPEVSTRALKASWYHKWIVNLRQRPEDYGALVHAHITNTSPMPQAAGVLHPDVLNSAGLAASYSKFGSYLMPQAFNQGAPGHPCYPAGHGTVGGACITALRFFFDGSQPIRPLLQAVGSDIMMASDDGLTLVPYTGADRDEITIDNELTKLAYNITFGHGIHSGIHFRSSSQYAVLLGEQVGLSVLTDRAQSYFEPFSITITKFDGTKVTINNPGH